MPIPTSSVAVFFLICSWSCSPKSVLPKNERIKANTNKQIATIVKVCSENTEASPPPSKPPMKHRMTNWSDFFKGHFFSFENCKKTRKA